MTVLKSTSSLPAAERIHHQDWSKGTPKDFPLSCASPLVDQLSTPSVSGVCFGHLQSSTQQPGTSPTDLVKLNFCSLPNPSMGPPHFLGQRKPSHQLRGTRLAPAPMAHGLRLLLICFLFFKYQKHVSLLPRGLHTCCSLCLAN